MNARAARFQALASGAKSGTTSQDFDAVETRSLARALWQGRWKIGGLALGMGLLVWLLMQQVTPTYTVYAKLMLDTRKAEVNASTVLAEVAPSEEVVNSEIGVLQSNLVIEKMLSGLTQAQRDALDPDLRTPSMTRRIKGFVKGLISAPPPVVQDETAHQARLVEAVRDIRSAYAQPQSYVMVVRVDLPDPALARDVANGLADAYIALQIENRRATVVRATTWLQDQLVDLQAKVESSERAVAEFQAQSLISEGGTLENVSKQLSDLNTQLAASRSARVEALSRLDQLNAALVAEDVDAAASVVATPAMADLAAQRLKLRQDDAVWARTYDTTQARRVEIATKLEEIRVSMLGELQSAIAAGRSQVALAQSRELGLSDSIHALEAQVMDMTGNQIGLRQLTREADAARQTYESFLARINETRAQTELQQPDAVIVERATRPESPSAPRPTLLSVLAVTVTAALATAWVLFKEMAPVSYRSARELTQGTGMSVLTSLPDEGWTETRAMISDLKANPHSTYAERIRQIRTALTLRRLTPGRGHSMQIMGAAPGEGKTTTALALTHMIALSGRTVIIVDCDLRRPTVLRALGGRRNRARDFADFIEYKCDLPEAIYRPAGYGFDVLGLQEPLRSGADALSVTWLAQVLRELERAYDFVIVDAPALLAVPDALIVAQEVQTNLFLVSADHTTRDMVGRGLTTLSEMGIEIRGLILNKVDPRRSSDPFEGGYGYDYWFPKAGRAVPSKRNWLGYSPRSAGGDHSLLAGWHARWREGARAALHHVSAGRYFHPRLPARQDQPADPQASRDHHIGR